MADPENTSSALQASSIDPAEVAKFARLAEQWWDPQGPFAPLHRFNPIRLKFIRDTAAQHFGRDILQPEPFRGLSLVDLGCGGGLLSEPLARLGFDVLGCDAVARNIEAAAAHAKEAGLELSYRYGTAEDLAAEGRTFDVVLAMEIVEHVADLDFFVGAALKLLSPYGILFLATINRTLKSLALAKIGAEYILRWLPPGTHEWSRFIKPHELRDIIARNGAQPVHTQGVIFHPLYWEWQLADDTDVNYVIVASR